MAQSDLIKVKIDGLETENIILRDDFELKERKENRKEVRRNRKDKVTHFFAGTIILSFLILVICQIFFEKDMPDYFVSIVAMVVGFYFGREL